MRVGLYYDLRNPPRWRRDWALMYGRTLESIEEAERLGIGSVWVTEHHLFEDGYMGQPLQICAAIAARTSRVRIGTAVVLAPLHPAIDIAEQAATVDILSGGRLELGLGAGYRVPEFTVYGQDVGRRFELLEERVQEVRRLWAQDIATPPPVQDPLPLWLGVMGPRGARMAGRLGTGLLWLGDGLLEPYELGLRQGGHDPATRRQGGLANFILADDPEAALACVAPHVIYQRESYSRYGAEGRADGSTGALTVTGGPVNVESLRKRFDPPTSPGFDVVTPDEAISRLSAWLGDRPVTDIFMWATIAGMPDDVADRHCELVATVLAPALADVGVVTGPASTAGASG
jgi:alkanesulfonate monooxygenase SsuD/methylene tetrahydromethanopterin reductase-like flavin-dependent oxidoreductase (luciferase family)